MKKNTKNKSYDTDHHVPNLERALSVFELFNHYPEGLSISDVADKLQIPRNSAHRIMMTLYQRDYLIRDEDTKDFRLTKKLLVIGYGALSEKKLVEYALGPMRELRDETKETVPLGVLNNGNGIVIEQVSGLHMFKYVLEPGKLFHLHTAAPAKAILAFLPQNEQNRVIKKITFKKFNSRTIVDCDAYKETLTITRQTGYSIDRGEEYEGMHCLSAPIFDQHGYPIASIWITGPSDRILKENFDILGKQVKFYADKISRKFGYGINDELQTQKF